jgi:GT2 family glycosyltransferase
MISVVIPVLNQLFLTNNLLDYISNNTVKPVEIFLVDNASSEDIQSSVRAHPDLNIIYLRQKKNIGVNASWNIGIQLAKGNFLSILNNDIILPKFFFKYIRELMIKHKEVGICVPNTVEDKTTVVTTESYPYIKTSPLSKREGWAFTIRSSIASACYPIPRSLKMFFGDDYLFGKTRELGYTVVKMITNPIYHYGSITLSSTLGDLRSLELLKDERKIWEGMKK